jgi:hypothetical protein
LADEQLRKMSQYSCPTTFNPGKPTPVIEISRRPFEGPEIVDFTNSILSIGLDFYGADHHVFANQCFHDQIGLSLRVCIDGRAPTLRDFRDWPVRRGPIRIFQLGLNCVQHSCSPHDLSNEVCALVVRLAASALDSP